MVEMRRSMTLSDHMSTPVSSAATRRSQTLRSAIASEAFAAAAAASGTSRTLMDIIREEHAISRGEFPLNPADGAGGGVSWKGFKDRLRLRRTSAAWTDAAAAAGGAGAGGEPDDEHGDLVIGFPTSPVFGRAIAARLNQAQMPGSLRERDPGDIPTPSVVQIIHNPSEVSSSSSSGEEGGAADGEPERVSLMALLGQSDPENGMSDEEDAEEEEVVVEEKARGGVHHVCCVCMVRHKGAAFIPCGHTFCRLCSRELWVSRGNCPLCNGYILEILDIF